IDRYAVKGHENAIWPRVVEGRHLPIRMRRTINVVVSKEPVKNEEDGFLAEILVTQKICECGVTCRTVAVGREPVVRVLAPVGIDTRSSEQILRTKCHPCTHVRSQHRSINEVRGLNHRSIETRSVAAWNRERDRVGVELRLSPAFASCMVH